MTPDEERQCFLKALVENPYDEATHRAFADWLYERGEDGLAEYHATWTKETQEEIDAFNREPYEFCCAEDDWYEDEDRCAC